MRSQNCLCNANPDLNRIICLRLHLLITIRSVGITWMLMPLHHHHHQPLCTVQSKSPFFPSAVKHFHRWMRETTITNHVSKMPARSDIVRISHLHTYNTFGRINIAPRTCIVWWVYGTYWVLERNSIRYTMYGCSLFNVSWQWCSCLCIVNYYDYANDFAMLLNFENDWLLWECFQSIKHMPDWSGFLANFYLL